MVTIRNHNIILPADFTKKLHPKVQYELGKMNEESQLRFQRLYQDRIRSLKLAYICLAFFPGTHYAFLGRWQVQGLFWLTLGGAFIWWLVDFYRLPAMVKQTNYLHQMKIIRELNSVSVFKTHKPLIVPKLTPARVA